MTELTGVLKDAVIHEHEGIRYITGLLHGDSKGRFREGELVRTSYIVDGPDADGVVRTRNSVYKLEMKSKLH